jgi:hypothetical protein
MNIQKFLILFLMLFSLPSQSCWPFKRKVNPLQKTVQKNQEKKEKQLSKTTSSALEIVEIEESEVEPNWFSARDLQGSIFVSTLLASPQDLMWILNRHPKLLHEKICVPDTAIARNKICFKKPKKTPLEMAESFEPALEKYLEKIPNDQYCQRARAYLPIKIPMMKLLLWKSNFKKAYQSGKVQLPFKQKAPALDAIIVGYLVDPCKPQQNQKQLEKN